LAPWRQTRALEQGQSIEPVAEPGSVEVRPCRKSKGLTLVRSEAVALAGPDVADDFPQSIPVLERELEVIETYLGELLDTMGWRQ
jgi:hypothetical protein